MEESCKYLKELSDRMDGEIKALQNKIGMSGEVAEAMRRKKHSPVSA